MLITIKNKDIDNNILAFFTNARSPVLSACLVFSLVTKSPQKRPNFRLTNYVKVSLYSVLHTIMAGRSERMKVLCQNWRFVSPLHQRTQLNAINRFVFFYQCLFWRDLLKFDRYGVLIGAKQVFSPLACRSLYWVALPQYFLVNEDAVGLISIPRINSWSMSPHAITSTLCFKTAEKKTF